MNRAYIYVGGNARRVTEEARNFAKSLNCKGPSSGRRDGFCGSCPSCRAFDGGSHPDVFYVRGAKKSIGVDDIREQLVLPMAVKPYSHRYKVFIVEGAQELTPQAQSALLKTIEEPADYGVFLFVAPSVGSFLPTVLSRASVVKFSEEADASCGLSAEMQGLGEALLGRLGKADLYDAFLLYGMLDKKEKIDRGELARLLDFLYIKCGAAGSGAACSEILGAKQAIAQNASAQLAMELLFARLSGFRLG